MKATRVLLGFVLWSVPGCLDVCLDPPARTFVEWVQESVYEEFPPPGQKGNFSVEHRPNVVGTVGRKVATRELPDEQISLEAWQSGTLAYLHIRPDPLSNEETWRGLNASFAELGLPAPEPGVHVFEWTRGACYD